MPNVVAGQPSPVPLQTATGPGTPERPVSAEREAFRVILAEPSRGGRGCHGREGLAQIL